ncbi:MAG: hypothetical protein ACMG57_01710 [Candidatus Dojkabacteria bacterium]
MNLSITIEQILNNSPLETGFITSVSKYPLIDYISYPISEDEKHYQSEDVIELFKLACELFKKDPNSFENQNELARCMSIMLHHFDIRNEQTCEVLQVLISPFIDICRAEFDNLSAKILFILHEEGDFASEKMVKSYQFFRKVLTPFSLDMDGNAVPIMDDIYVRRMFLIMEKALPRFDEELEFLDYVVSI